MAGSSLLALIDDISTLLDDVAVPGRLHEGDPLRLDEARVRRRRRTLGHVRNVARFDRLGVGLGWGSGGGGRVAYLHR